MKTESTCVCASRRAFSLVEMLVVLGIIALLAAMLLPGLINARKAAQLTKCLNNLRQIGLAVTQYVSDNRTTTPNGKASNCWDDPSSPRGGVERGAVRKRPVVGEQLDSYLKRDLRLWKCPGARAVSNEADGLMRTPVVVTQGLRPRADVLPEGFDEQDSLWGSRGKWRPGYFYVSTTGWSWFLIHQPLVWKHFFMEDWVVRNVAGLRTDKLKTVSADTSDKIVLFMDYSSTFHSKSPEDVYEVRQLISEFNNADPAVIRREQFRSNFLFLDGHCETREYGWAGGGLINRIHRPLKQTWGDIVYDETYLDGYGNRYPD